MQKIKFGKFMDGDYPEAWDIGSELYVIRDGATVFYVGISRRGIYNRWFSSFGSHIIRNAYGELIHGSDIGRLVISNLPDSRNWIIEFWTPRDCSSFLNMKHSDYDGALEFYEAEMVSRLRPSLNIMNARYHKGLNSFINEDELRDAHHKIFD